MGKIKKPSPLLPSASSRMLGAVMLAVLCGADTHQTAALNHHPVLTTRTTAPPLTMSAVAPKPKHIRPRGGAAHNMQIAHSLVASAPSTVHRVGDHAAAAWGVLGVIGILYRAIARLAPIAVQPFKNGQSPLHWTLYAVTVLFFAYAEGYKGFQRKFSPLVVARAFALKDRGNFLNIFLAPFYSMGLFHATKKRKYVSWGVVLGVTGLVAIVKRLPYPWRCIVDAGVVVGLSWGSISIAAIYAHSLFVGSPPNVDPQLPGDNA